MFIKEKEISIPKLRPKDGLLSLFEHRIEDQLDRCDIPIRFVVTKMEPDFYRCELGVLSVDADYSGTVESIFEYRQRAYCPADEFNVVLLIPTGIGAALGGHSGDGGAVARLIASGCDNLITHPNVVNAADINELPDNGLYVEGSVVTRLLMGTAGLQRVRSNRLLLCIDQHDEPMFHELAVNSASAARAALGLDCPKVVLLQGGPRMYADTSSSGRAVGRIDRFERLCRVLDQYRDQYDAIALNTLIDVPAQFHADYFKAENWDMVNPWGGVEAMLTHAVSLLYNVPSAHAPLMSSREILNLNVGIVDPRKAAEAVSTTYLHCVLKGLHKSPRIHPAADYVGHRGWIYAEDVSCMIIPDGCVGLPTLAAIRQGIPVIAVKENVNRMSNDLRELPFNRGQLHIVENYLEAVGVMHALKAGVSVETVRRPMAPTQVDKVDVSIETIEQHSGGPHRYL